MNHPDPVDLFHRWMCRRYPYTTRSVGVTTWRIGGMCRVSLSYVGKSWIPFMGTPFVVVIRDPSGITTNHAFNCPEAIRGYVMDFEQYR